MQICCKGDPRRSSARSPYVRVGVYGRSLEDWSPPFMCSHLAVRLPRTIMPVNWIPEMYNVKYGSLVGPAPLVALARLLSRRRRRIAWWRLVSYDGHRLVFDP